MTDTNCIFDKQKLENDTLMRASRVARLRLVNGNYILVYYIYKYFYFLLINYKQTVDQFCKSK